MFYVYNLENVVYATFGYSGRGAEGARKDFVFAFDFVNDCCVGLQ